MCNENETLVSSVVPSGRPSLLDEGEDIIVALIIVLVLHVFLVCQLLLQIATSPKLLVRCVELVT